jgi:hypothetical protein
MASVNAALRFIDEPREVPNCIVRTPTHVLRISAACLTHPTDPARSRIASTP